MDKFVQICVWPGTVVGADQVDEFTEFMQKTFDVRVKYAEEITTGPTIREGRPVPETGGRNDLLFYIHTDDIGKFAVPRLATGIRWWEDVIKYNDPQGIYPQEVIDKYPTTW